MRAARTRAVSRKTCASDAARAVGGRHSRVAETCVSSKEMLLQLPTHPLAHRTDVFNWCSQHLYTGLVECNHTLQGGVTPYSNQHGSGLRSESCQTECWKKLNGEEVVTSGPGEPGMPNSRVTLFFIGEQAKGSPQAPQDQNPNCGGAGNLGQMQASQQTTTGSDRRQNSRMRACSYRRPNRGGSDWCADAVQPHARHHGGMGGKDLVEIFATVERIKARPERAGLSTMGSSSLETGCSRQQ